MDQQGNKDKPPPSQQEQQGGGGKKRNKGRGGRGAGQGSRSDQGSSQGRGPGGPSQGPPVTSQVPPVTSQVPPGFSQGPPAISPFAGPSFSQRTQAVAPTDASKPKWAEPRQFTTPAPVQDTSSIEPSLLQQPKSGKGKGKKGVAKQPVESAQAPTPASAPQAVASAPVSQSATPAPAPSAPTPSQETSEKDPSLPQQPKSGKKRGKKGGAKQAEESQAPAAVPAQGAPRPAQSGKDGGKPKDRGDDGTSKAGPSFQGVTKQMGQMSISGAGESYIIPRRPQGQVIPRNPALFEKKFTIEVNYLPITFKDINLKIFHYDVEFKPDRPKSLYRPALRIFLDKYVGNRNPAFDGKKNMYAAGTKLQFPSGDTVRDSVTIHDPERDKDATFDITVKLVDQNLSLSKLAEYLKSGTSINIPQDVIQGIDIAMRNAPTMNSSFVPVGRSFFAIPREEPVNLGGGFELWHGHYQSAIMAWKPYLNVDVANKAFPIPQSLLDFIKYDLNADPTRPLVPDDRKKLSCFVKGLKIDYKLQSSSDPSGFTKRTYKVNDLGDPPNRHRFKPDKEGSREITVEHYFKDMKRIQLRFPHLPCIVTTNKNYLPLEFCSVTPNQAVMRKLDERQTASMVRSAAKGTDVRKDRIMATIGQSGFNNDPCAREFGIQLQTRFENVEAHILKSPKIRYANADVPVRSGVWQTRSEKFINSPGLDKWVILNTDRKIGGQQINNLVKNFMSTGGNIGIPVKEPLQVLDVSGRVRSESDFEQQFRQFKDKVQIVVVIMTSFGIDDIYSKIKRAAELKVGVLTQCIKSGTCDFRKMNPMTAQNILLKINSKISGVNHGLSVQTTPNILREPVMIVGAHVTHSAPGSSEGLSIAAVAASHDCYAFRYNMLYRLQPGRQEMIERLEEMIEQQLRFFYQRCNCKPKRILYYRDGVSEGQFLQVLNIELRAIRAACKKLEDGYEPAVTFLVVQKRHHTRFFPGPKDWDGPKNKNVFAGTLVDTSITHPTEVDFYLVSHQSIQGTARPTKYHLLWDDNNIRQDDLEQLTYYLCHMFARCNRSVSYPAPTYYAHLAAFRARAWWDGQRYDLTNLRGEQERNGRIQDHIVNNAPMFFV